MCDCLYLWIIYNRTIYHQYINIIVHSYHELTAVSQLIKLITSIDAKDNHTLTGVEIYNINKYL